MPDKKIDLSEVKKPLIIPLLDYEIILKNLIDDLKTRDPTFIDLVESDPAFKILEVVAYREFMLRQQVNKAGQSVMLAYATGVNLDNLAAFYNVKRLVKQKADPTAIPPLPEILEDDNKLKDRVLLSLNSISTAGARLNYVYYAKSASALVVDASAYTVKAGVVNIAILIGSKDLNVIAQVKKAVFDTCNADAVRPLTDKVVVEEAQKINFEIEGTLYFYRGPDTKVILARAIENLNRVIAKHNIIGIDFNLSAIYAALHITGVQRVELKKPSKNIVVDFKSFAVITSIKIVDGGPVDA